jgi:hemoglobin
MSGVEGDVTATSSGKPSIFEFAGGHDAFLALAAAHHRRCLEDPELNHPFSRGVSPHHIDRLAEYWAEVFGGPPRYSESNGGQPAMLAIHAGKGAGDDYGERFVGCFMKALDDARWPNDPGLRASLRSYMEWAVREVLACSPAGSQVPSGREVPRWSWDGLDTSAG